MKCTYGANGLAGVADCVVPNHLIVVEEGDAGGRRDRRAAVRPETCAIGI